MAFIGNWILGLGNSPIHPQLIHFLLAVLCGECGKLGSIIDLCWVLVPIINI